ncbi:hypothetical protein EVA_07075 [gut metagenome]|uniref:Uncharacterized protein n=1 Tax=gut metagenome TaxID=749906 RepID=J9GBW3_9ZZZZ
MTFVTVFTRSVLEGVHGSSLEAGILRREVSDGVVHLAEHDGFSTGVAAVEGFNTAHHDVGSGRSSGEGAEAAGHQLTVVVVSDKEGSLTVESLGVVLIGTVIDVEALFQGETNLGAVAEVFNSLHTDTGSLTNAGVQRQTFGRVFETVEVRHFSVLVLKAHVNLTVKGNVSSERGSSKSAENGNSSERFLEHFMILITVCGHSVRTRPEKRYAVRAIIPSAVLFGNCLDVCIQSDPAQA